MLVAPAPPLRKPNRTGTHSQCGLFLVDALRRPFPPVSLGNNRSRPRKLWNLFQTDLEPEDNDLSGAGLYKSDA